MTPSRIVKVIVLPSSEISGSLVGEVRRRLLDVVRRASRAGCDWVAAVTM